jgi:hypothetical protein
VIRYGVRPPTDARCFRPDGFEVSLCEERRRIAGQIRELEQVLGGAPVVLVPVGVQHDDVGDPYLVVERLQVLDGYRVAGVVRGEVEYDAWPHELRQRIVVYRLSLRNEVQGSVHVRRGVRAHFEVLHGRAVPGGPVCLGQLDRRERRPDRDVGMDRVCQIDDSLWRFEHGICYRKQFKIGWGGKK